MGKSKSHSKGSIMSLLMNIAILTSLTGAALGSSEKKRVYPWTFSGHSHRGMYAIRKLDTNE
jgi:hypothetical protein